MALIRANIDLFRAFINISEPQLERISRLGDQLSRQIEASSPSSRADLQDTRYRAFSYFASLYTDIVTMGGYVYAKTDTAETRYISLYTNLYTNLTRRPAVSPNSAARDDSFVSPAADGVAASGDGESVSGNGETSSDEPFSGANTPSSPSRPDRLR